MLKKEIYGMNAPVLLTICGIVIIACLLGVLPTTFIGAMAICMVLGFVLGWIGDRIPIWKDYFGGGAILAYFGAAALVKFNFIPEKTVDSVVNFIGGYDFLTVFIAVLLAGSIMTVNRKLLIRAISGYIPAILAGIV
ncbi:MAG TPA: citrate:sodium symporter, partial [Firmicutes bacterium]|nr:citrate:sodium symporter [Bacillota bacterium]